MSIAKKYSFHKECRDELFKGIQLMYDAVSATLGPHGRAVLLERGYGLVEPTRDGVTVADEIRIPDTFPNMGCQLVREAAQKANVEAGDSTTTAIVLAYNMAKEGLNEVNKRANVYQIGKGMQLACDVAVKELEKMAVKITTEDDFAKVATISTQDEDIGKLIAKTFVEAGEFGCIDIERSDYAGIKAEKTEGISFDKGWDSKLMFQSYLTDLNKKKCEVEDIPVLVVEDKIENESQLLPILNQLADDKKTSDQRWGWPPAMRKLMVVCDEFSGSGMGLLINNRMRIQTQGRVGFHLIYVIAPSYGRHKVEIMQDIAAVTGGTFISKEHGNKRVEQATLEDLGRAKKVIVEDKRTIIVSETGKGDWGEIVKKKIDERITLLKAEIEDMPNDHVDKPELRKRLATLTDGVSVLKVGAEGENERNELRRRVEDGVRAVKSAKEEGVTPGCGVALLQCVPAIEQLMKTAKNDDQRKGMEILMKALHSVTIRLLEVGFIEDFTKQNPNADVYRKALVEQMKNEGKGYDFENDCLADMMEKGVLDAKKAVRVALQSATSCAMTFLKIDCAVAHIDGSDDLFEKIAEKLRAQ